MIYTFRDTNGCPSDTAIPAEAMNFNGVFLENEIEGYRTLYVNGRESLAPELDTYDTGARAGALLKRRRFPTRPITVGYQLLSRTPEDFRQAFNKMARILNVQEGRMVFADEPDKYFTGTLSGMGDIEPGRNNITAELEFTCLDPFKYSMEETLYSLRTLSRVEYEGTQPCYPRIRWDIKGNTGYVGAFLGDASTIIQIGNPYEGQLTSNTFAAGDVVVADCASATITVNGVIRDNLGAVGNAWESFLLTPGENLIGALSSSWAQRPDITLAAREVWL